MRGDLQTLDRHDAESLLGWWLEAGVDVATGDTPRDWLKPVVAPVAAAARSPAPSLSPPPETLADLAAFRAWLAEAGGLPLDRPGARRILPSGAEAAPLMLLSDLPGPDEVADGRLIGGPAWQLTQAMLRAIGITPDDAYIAALACFHAPGARLARDELERCGVLAREHVRLAAPDRLLLLGDAPARALTGQPLGSARGRVHRVEGVRTVATFHPRWLLQRPADKALAWADLRLLMSDEG